VERAELAVDLHQEGRLLVEDIIRRKRVRMFLEGIPECEACRYPRPGTFRILCFSGCSHNYCPACAGERTQSRFTWLDHHFQYL
jgi:hypothetical protein